MSDFTFRLATPADAEAFAKWAAENQEIDQADLRAGMKANSPTVVVFVVERDGVPVLFAPVYLAAVLAHLGFAPEARATDRLRALGVLKDGVSAFMVQFGVREVQTLSKPEYGIAKWATANGFDVDSRNLFRLDLNKEMEHAAQEK